MPSTLTAGSRLGSYEVLSSLGRGGMGEVYRARDTKLNRDVAIKVLLPSVSNDSDRLTRFRREAQLLASLNHPNIAHIYGLEDSFEVGSFLVLELVEGPTLANLIAQASGSGLPLSDALPLARQIAEALEAAHEKGIIHRNLKPANIKVREDGTVKVLDFGLAKALVTDPSSAAADEDLTNSPTLTAVTQAGMILGTAAYMSPEQAAGKPVDRRSDLWAFGVVLFEMLTARRVFAGETVTHVLAAVLKDTPDWHALPANTPAPIRRLLRHCLEKNRRQRLDSATAARLEIDDALTAPADASAPSASPWTTRTMSGAIVLSAIVAGATALITLQMRETRSEGPSTDALTYTPLSFEPGGNSDAVWSPDGKGVAFAARQRDDEPEQVYVRYLDSSTPTQLTHLDAPAWPVGWTTAGRIVFRTTAAPAGLWTISQTGGQPEPLLARAGTNPVGGVAASAGVSLDGSAVAYYGNDGAGTKAGVWISAPAGSPPTRYEPAPFEVDGITNFPKIRFSPDGKQLLLVRHAGGVEEVWLMPYPMDPGQPPRRIFETTLPDSRPTPWISWMPDNRRVIMAVPSDAEPARLFVADTVSGAFSLLSSGTASQIQPVVSPDGTRLVFTESAVDFDVVQVNVRTGHVSPVLATRRREDMPAWAMNASVMAYVTDRTGQFEIWLHQPGGPDRSVVTTRDLPPGTRVTSPVVSPDGTRIIYQVVQPDGSQAMWLAALSGGTPVRVTDTRLADIRERPGAWSPDGAWFVYDSLQGGTVDSLRRVRTTGQATPEELVPDFPRTGDGVPAWSPTGEWILHQSNGWRLRSPDGKTERDLSLRANVCAFSRDAVELYCVRAAGLGGTLFARSVAGGPERVIATLPASLLPANQVRPGLKMTLTPDGEHVTYSVRKQEDNLWLLEGLGAAAR